MFRRLEIRIAKCLIAGRERVPAGARANGGRLALLCLCLASAATARAEFTPLIPVPVAHVVSHSESFPGDAYKVGHLFDGLPRTEYAASGKDANPVVQLQFAKSVRLAAFQHIDRNDPATVAASELILLDADGRVTATVPVSHANKPGGETFAALPAPTSANGVRWRVTRLGKQGLRTVGGAEMAFFAAGEPEPAPARDRIEVRPLPFLQRDGAAGRQPVKLTVHHEYLEEVDAVLRVEGADLKPLHLKPGDNLVELTLPAASTVSSAEPVQTDTTIRAALELGGKTVVEAQFGRKPVRPLTVYILPHSHTDIGYTEIQTAIEKKQVQNLVDGIAHARRTASYPDGARFIWNVEVLWAADLYLRRLDERQRADFLEAIKKGQVVLNGMYLNELTGLCRPEELIRLFRFATRISEQTGATVDSAMISDVPGYTWGTVTAMAQAGIKYFSTAPNYFDRIGTILREWENKPFYWVGPDGKSKVLVWIPFWGYAMSHRYRTMSPQLVEDLCYGLEARGYPYETAYVRWSGHGDNAAPDPSICEFVKDWNAQYAWPRFIISGTGEAFRALEQRYGEKLPKVRGDWTPYWEDGAGSSALETSMNRQSSDRLAQAETLFTMLNPQAYPAKAFEEAWNNVLLYSEHTWGAWCSVKEPERKETQEQWAIKKSYAEAGGRQSRELLHKALAAAPAAGAASEHSVDVYNTLSWTRSELVSLPRELSSAGDRVLDEQGTPVPSQRLASGELLFLAREVPALAARRFTVSAGIAHVEGKASAEGAVLDNGRLRVRVDEKTGGIIELSAKGMDGNFADTSGGESLNDYLYLPGDDLKDLKRSGPLKTSVGEKGPLLASLVIESDAPGCKSLRRELRIVAGMDYLEVINVIDKLRPAAKSYMDREGKESVNFAFPFNVPDGEMLLDIPLGVMRPEQDQMPSACKNWLTVGRWVDVSNAERGLTWVTLDAPLVQVGGLTARLLNSQTDPDVWRKHVEPTQKLYCWAMNNHWGTNYRAYQEGLTTFRFVLRPHAQSTTAEASRFATRFSQPLIAIRARGQKIASTPLLTVTPADVLVTALKPSDDAKGYIIRIYGASDQPTVARLEWGRCAPKHVFLSDTSERRGEEISAAVTVPAEGLVTLRAELE